MSEAVRGFGTGSRAKWNSSTPTSRQTSHQMVAGAGGFPFHQGMQGGGDNGGVERGEVRNSIRSQSDKMHFSLASKAEERKKREEKNKLIHRVFLPIRLR